MSAVPVISVRFERLTGTFGVAWKFLISCVCLCVPSTWTIVKEAVKLVTFPFATLRFHVPAKTYGVVDIGVVVALVVVPPVDEVRFVLVPGVGEIVAALLVLLLPGKVPLLGRELGVVLVVLALDRLLVDVAAALLVLVPVRLLDVVPVVLLAEFNALELELNPLLIAPVVLVLVADVVFDTALVDVV